MTHINKTLLIATIALGGLVAGVLGQTIYRNRQVETLRNDIKAAIKNADDPNEAVAVIQSYEEQIAYVYAHKPLLNLDIGLTNSFATQTPQLCSSIYQIMTSNTVVRNFLENTNLAAGASTRALEQSREIQTAARGLYLVSGCLP